MKLLRSLGALDAVPPTARHVVTIGAFDGLHIGHRAILEQAREAAARLGHSLAVLSFEPTPAEYFAPAAPPPRLTCFRERFELLAALGVDTLLCPNFRAINAIDHERFVERVLVRGLNLSHVVVGHDFRYGAGRQGSLASLRAAGAAAGFDVTVVDAVYRQGRRVSSTAIRSALGAGDLGRARDMLGRDYSMSGRVVYGLGRGRDFGMPTANVNLKRRRAPVDGIFAVKVDGLADAPLDGVASVGSRPTVGGGTTLLEVHLFDFDERIYGRYINVRFMARLRDEEKFPTIAALQAQMHADAAAAKAALSRGIA